MKWEWNLTSYHLVLHQLTLQPHKSWKTKHGWKNYPSHQLIPQSLKYICYKSAPLVIEIPHLLTKANQLVHLPTFLSLKNFILCLSLSPESKISLSYAKSSHTSFSNYTYLYPLVQNRFDFLSWFFIVSGLLFLATTTDWNAICHSC